MARIFCYGLFYPQSQVTLKAEFTIFREQSRGLLWERFVSDDGERERERALYRPRYKSGRFFRHPMFRQRSRHQDG